MTNADGGDLMGDYSDVVLALAPLGYWRLGESSGTTMFDRSSRSISGTCHSVALGTPGAIVGDLDTAVSFNGRTSYAEIPDHKIYSLTRAWDDFDRNNRFSWGTARSGDPWQRQVSTGNFYQTISGPRPLIDEGNGIIDPHRTRGTYQQGLPTHLLSGDMQVRASWSEHAVGGALQPVALVAQRVDNNNFVRAELLEHANHSLEIQLIRTVNGQNEYLASKIIGSYVVGDWYYLRFQFDGANLKARAWRSGSKQPIDWDVTADIPIAQTGSIAIRSANSGTGQTARPVVKFRSFWAQTIGFTIHMFLKLNRHAQSADRVFPFGKGDTIRTHPFKAANMEYYLRYERVTDDLKGYAFSLGGGLGAGVNLSRFGDGRWHQVVVMLDSGDALDTCAGVTGWLDGRFLEGQPAPYATERWQVYPLSGDAPVRLGGGTSEKEPWRTTFSSTEASMSLRFSAGS